MKTLLFISLFLVTTNLGSAQSSLSTRLLTVGAHPFAKQNLPMHHYKIDTKGYITFEAGLIFSYDRYLAKNLTFRFSTSVMNDRFKTLAGYSQAMLKYKLFKYYKHSFYIGFGPSVFYETDKSDIETWVNEDGYKKINNTLYKIGWLSGMIEYNYYLSKQMDLALTLNHIHSRSFAVSIGVRFDLPDPNGKGCDCPSFR